MSKGNNIRLGQELRRLAANAESKSREEIVDYLYDRRDRFTPHIQSNLISLKMLCIVNDVIEETVILTDSVIQKLADVGISDIQMKEISFVEARKAYSGRLTQAMGNFVLTINEVTLSPAFREHNEPYALKNQKYGQYMFVSEEEYRKGILVSTYHRAQAAITKLGILNPEDNTMNEILRMLGRYGKTYKLK
jgi:hypothetical protein